MGMGIKNRETGQDQINLCSGGGITPEKVREGVEGLGINDLTESVGV